MIHFFRFILLISTLIFVTACSKKSANSPQVQQVLVTGDPMTFIDETSQDTASGIPLSLFEEGGRWTFHTIGFVTRPQIKIESQEQAEISQAPTSQQQTEAMRDRIYDYQLERVPAFDGETVNFDPVQSKNPFRFVFRKQGEALFLTTIKDLNQLEAVARDFRVEHYSVKSNQRSFSILFSFAIEDERVLIAYYFSKETEQPFLQQVLNETYNYFWGPGVKMGWNQNEPVHMTICNRGAGASYADLTASALNDWVDNLEGRLEVTHEKALGLCPPFSDLNSHTIFHVSDWIQVEGTAGTMAFVPPIPDYSQSYIIDGDVFPLEGEWNEAISSRDPKLSLSSKQVIQRPGVRAAYEQTMKHEFGHILGLGHVFDDEVTSVMSYDDVPIVTDYDKDFAGELYPVKAE